MWIEPAFISVAVGNPMLLASPSVPNVSPTRVPGTMSPFCCAHRQTAWTTRFDGRLSLFTP
jgi:hypothetical protein